MQIIETGIQGLVEIQPKVFGDERGYFFESYREDTLSSYFGEKISFIQDNQSYSTKGVLRGLHLQQGDHAQGKLVRVLKGKVLDVAVDLRPNSATFGKSYSVVLDTDRHNMFYVPPGFGHGFYTIEDAIFCYKCTAYFNKASEAGVHWEDKDLGIDWQLNGIKPLVSEKDQVLLSFNDFKEKIYKGEIIL